MRRTRAKYYYTVRYTKRCENDRRKRKMAESVSTYNQRDLWLEFLYIVEQRCTTRIKPKSHQAYDQVTTYLRPKNGPIVERTYDWSQRSWVIARGKPVGARSWSCSKPSHTGLTTRLRPTCDRKKLQSWANRRKNVRLAAEVVRLVAEVVGDRKRQITRNKVDGHVQNLKPAIPNRKRSHDQSCKWSCHLTIGGTTNRWLMQNSTIDRTIDCRGPRLIVRSTRLWLPLVIRFPSK